MKARSNINQIDNTIKIAKIIMAPQFISWYYFNEKKNSLMPILDSIQRGRVDALAFRTLIVTAFIRVPRVSFGMMRVIGINNVEQ